MKIQDKFIIIIEKIKIVTGSLVRITKTFKKIVEIFIENILK